jgi:hypothetical protein
MLQMRFAMRVFAVVWLLFISVLFFLPGSTLPKGGLFDIPYFDKYVHIGFFTVLLFAWRFYFDAADKYFRILLALAFCYGMGVEVVQHFFVANRSFDLTDVVADMLGALAGLFIWQRWYKKNRPL